MQIFQLEHPRNEIILCDGDCDLAACFLEIGDARDEKRLCPLHTHSAVHAATLPKRGAGAGFPYRSRPRTPTPALAAQ